MRGLFATGKRLLRRVAHVLARPVRGDRGRGGVLIQPYRGFGSAEEVYLMGRVFYQTQLGQHLRSTPSRRDFLDVIRRVLRRGVAGATLEARIIDQGGEPLDLAAPGQRFVTDADGYFRIRLRSPQPLATDQRWHHVELQLIEPSQWAGDEGAKIQGEVFVPPPESRRVIISDIDDTVMYTGVMNKVMMMWRLFMQGPRSRVAFPGVASLYRALHHGPAGDELNPMLYVSRAPWGIYEVLQEFFRLHHIPVGPILFLREWGITWTWPLPRKAEEHKLLLIREMLELYRDLPFVLIGDSGQHDPEVYAQVVQEYPGRVAAVYIRNVSRSTSRVQAIEDLAKRLLQSGSPLMLASDSFSMAEHAVEHGLIAPQALQEVLGEQGTGPDAVPRGPTREIVGQTAAQTRQAIEQGALEGALEEGDAGDSPPNIVVESKRP